MPKKHGMACLLAALSTTSAFAADAPETERSVEGVRAVEAHWQKAFLAGDSAYLETLLDPAYVSVGHAGSARPKAEIIALSKKVAEKKMTPPPEHPAAIVVRDNAAIVTDSANGDTSVDVFYYAGGRWHAWYSQHTPVEAAK